VGSHNLIPEAEFKEIDGGMLSKKVITAFHSWERHRQQEKQHSLQLCLLQAKSRDLKMLAELDEHR
jgi:hypothetical protein